MVNGYLNLGDVYMYSYIYFKENDALKEFMNLCIEKHGLTPDISKYRYKKILSLSKQGFSIGVRISNDPVCITISFIKHTHTQCYCNIRYCYNLIEHIIKDLISCANKYNIVLGVWVEDVDIPIYKKLGFRVIEVSEKVWMEYSQLLN